MSRHIPIPGFALMVLLLVAGPARCEEAKPSPAPPDPTSFAAMGGEDLIRALLEPSTRARAFQELSRRASPGTEAGFDAFQNTHRKPEVVVCPQDEGKKPVYLVLYVFLSHHEDDKKDKRYRLDNPDALFPPVAPTKLQKRRGLAMAVFTADGRSVNPFRHNDNVLNEGILADFNGDGLIERAGSIPFGDESARLVHVFKLDVVLERERPLLAVAYNFGPSEDWGYVFTDREVDEALLKCLDPRLADDLINFTLGKACRALALRGRVEHFDALVAALNGSKDGHVAHEVIGALAHMARQGGAGLKARLLPVLKPHLHKTTLMITEVIWAVWAADLRELKGDLEAIATARPEDPEGPKASSYGGEPKPVSERYHLARQVAAVWNEEDPVARARLLIAIGQSGDLHRPERLDALRQEISRLSGLLTPDQSQDVRRYLEWISTKGVMPDVHEIVRAAFK